MPKHRRALCLLYFSTKSFYVNLSNIKCHSEVSLSGSSRLASAKVRRSYITTKLSSHFFHDPSAGNMHISCTKPSKTADLRPEKFFQLFLTADCKYEKKMRLLQENNMKIAPNMLNNIFIALRTPIVSSPTPQHAPVCQHFARLHAPCAQAAVEQNADAVGTFFHGVGSFFHGGVTFSHGIPCRTGSAQQARDAVKKNAHSVRFSRHRIHFLRSRGQKKGDAT